VIFASEVAKPRSSRSATGWAGDRDVVAATKHGQIVALTPADTDVPGRRTGSKTLGELLLGELERAARGGPPSGGHIPARTESPDPKRRARESVLMAARFETPLIQAEQLLICRVLPARNRRSRRLGSRRSDAGARRSRAPARHVGGLLRYGRGHDRDGAQAAPVGARGDPPPRPSEKAVRHDPTDPAQRSPSTPHS
jgi:hypothetical protein